MIWYNNIKSNDILILNSKASKADSTYSALALGISKVRIFWGRALGKGRRGATDRHGPPPTRWKSAGALNPKPRLWRCNAYEEMMQPKMAFRSRRLTSGFG